MMIESCDSRQRSQSNPQPFGLRMHPSHGLPFGTSPACKSIRVLLNLVNRMPQGSSMMKISLRLLLAFALLISLVSPLLADTIRLKDGSVIRGQVIGFKDQQFTILVGGGRRCRRGQ